MLNKINSSLSKIEDFKKKKFLLAVSGGVDSMVLLSVFNQLNLNFAVAHCNFKLRINESDIDQVFVGERCKEIGRAFFTIDFDTTAYKKQYKLSTQMAARDLRYNWFDSILRTEGYDYIVTAHHLDDNVETVLLNLTRGTGIDGVTGMKLVSNFVFRPMLTCSKQEIRNYSEGYEIQFREDASNLSNDYKRNNIRNKIIPLFQEMNPSFVETMGDNMNNFNEIKTIYDKAIEKKLSDSVIKTKGEDFFIDIERIKSFEFSTTYLYEFLKRFEFNYSQVSQIIRVINSKNYSGKYFFSNSHKLLIDRVDLILSPINEMDNKEVEIIKLDKNVTYPVLLTLNTLTKDKVELILDSNQAFLDADKLVFPLKLRKWKDGDSFQPFGMVGKKKISDFLIDKKLSRIEKDKTYVLLSDEKIVWLIGHRISDNFKISSATENVLNVILK